MKISGNGWIVTGGLGGLGRVIATSLLAEGGSVVVSRLAEATSPSLLLESVSDPTVPPAVGCLAPRKGRGASETTQLLRLHLC